MPAIRSPDGRPPSPVPPELDDDVSESAALHDPQFESLGEGLVRPRDEVVAEPKLVADGVELGELTSGAGA